MLFNAYRSFTSMSHKNSVCVLKSVSFLLFGLGFLQDIPVESGGSKNSVLYLKRSGNTVKVIGVILTQGAKKRRCRR